MRIFYDIFFVKQKLLFGVELVQHKFLLGRAAKKLALVVYVSFYVFEIY